MFGQLVMVRRGRGQTAAGRLYGLPVLRAEVDLNGFWGERRLRRAARLLRRGGVLRVLVPPDFDRWPELSAFGLRPMDPELLIRAQSVPLALAALERRGLLPGRATVALRGLRVDWDMARTAEALCSQVRGLVIDVPRGGEELALRLRREFGVPVLPGGERGQLALAFQEGRPVLEETVLELWGSQPRLAGLRLSVPGLEEGDQWDLPLLAALWEGGKLGPGDIKIT